MNTGLAPVYPNTLMLTPHFPPVLINIPLNFCEKYEEEYEKNRGKIGKSVEKKNREIARKIRRKKEEESFRKFFLKKKSSLSLRNPRQKSLILFSLL